MTTLIINKYYVIRFQFFKLFETKNILITQYNRLLCFYCEFLFFTLDKLHILFENSLFDDIM